MRRASIPNHPIAALVVGLLAALPAAAQGGIDAPALRRFAGTYATACADPAAARLRITADALLVEQGGQRLTGRKPMSAYSYFGNSPPPRNFQVALLSEVRGGPQLIFMAYVDATGPYLLLDGDPKVTAALGRTLMAATYRRCGPPAASVAAPPPPTATTPVPAAPGGVPERSVLIADPAFRRAYLRALGPKASERWLARFDGPAPPTREQRFDGVPYLVVAICKAHDCYDHNAVFLYAAAQQRVLGLIQQNGAKTLVGAPGPALASQLDRLWLKEWRQK
ncbi:MAG: Ivy family c-type lysozyme inhibitor [Burkholderiales bacterium]